MTETRIIRFYATKWCPDCIRARKLLDSLNVPYEYIDVNQDKEARQYVEKVNRGNCSVPTIIFPDDSILIEPSNAALSEKLIEMKLI